MPSKSLKMPQKSLQPAFLTDQVQDIFQFLLESLKQDKKCALVTLTDIIGGASRGLGAHMAVREDGLYCGFVSGGCVEAAIAGETLQAIGRGQDHICHFGKDAPYFDIILPCGGSIKLAIHLLKKAEPIEKILSFLAKRQSAFLTYHPKTQTLTATQGERQTGWQKGSFIRCYRPALRLFLSGGAYEAGILAQIAQAANIDVLYPVTSQTEIFSALENEVDKNTAIALLHHDPEYEFPILKKALESKAFYIGCLGSFKTHQQRQARLTSNGFSAKDVERLHGPIGLFGPARDARTLAISVLAEIIKEANNYSRS